MSQDSLPRPALTQPFSRPTHPELPAVISPSSEAGRPLRPTPYASAVIPHLMAGSSPPQPEAVAGGVEAEELETAVSAPAPVSREADHLQGAPAPGAREPERDLPSWSDYLASAHDSQPAAASELAAEAMTAPVPEDAGVEIPTRERHSIPPLRELLRRHDQSTGVPANPETAVEAVDSAADYPTETPWPSESIFDWAEGDSGSETESASSAGSQAGDGGGHEAGSDLPHLGTITVAAAALERVADALRRGDLSLPALSGDETDPAILASVLSALLATAPYQFGGSLSGTQEASVAERER